MIVAGVVQGVGFRYSLARVAQSTWPHSRAVGGWVRNRPDGTVEAVFEGAPEAVESLVAWCRHGPRGAGVEAIEVYDEPPEGLAGFGIR